MHKARDIGIALKRLQKAHPRRQLFVILYDDGSGGLYHGTLEKHTELFEWPDGEVAARVLDAEVRKLFQMNSHGYPE